MKRVGGGGVRVFDADEVRDFMVFMGHCLTIYLSPNQHLFLTIKGSVGSNPCSY